MITKTCGAYEGPFKRNGVFEKHLRQCKRKAKYYCPDCNMPYCEIHLKKHQFFDVNPIHIESKKEIDRHMLSKLGKIKFVKEDLK